MILYCPPKGTAGLAMVEVKGASLRPSPPASSMAIHSFLLICYPSHFFVNACNIHAAQALETHR
ncbi:hypothetical protein D3C73_849340 [compost metagenome]